MRTLLETWCVFSGFVSELAGCAYSRRVSLESVFDLRESSVRWRSPRKKAGVWAIRNALQLSAQGELLEERRLLSAEHSLTIRSGSAVLTAETSWLDKDVFHELKDEQNILFPASEEVDEVAEVGNFYPYNTLTSARLESQHEFFNGLTLAVQTVGQRTWEVTERQPNGTFKTFTNAQQSASASAEISLNLEAEPLPGRAALTPVWVQMDSIIRPDGTDPDELGSASFSLSPTIDTFTRGGTEYYLVNTGQTLNLQGEAELANGQWGGDPFRYAAVSVAPTRIIRPEIRADYFWYEPAAADEPIGNDTINLWYSHVGLAPEQSWTLSIYWAQVTDSPDGSNDVSIREIAYRSQQTAQLGRSPGDRVNAPLTVKVEDLTDRPDGVNHLLLRLDDGPVDGGIGDPQGELAEVNEANNSMLLSVTPNVTVAEPSWNWQEGGLDLNYSVTNRYWLTGDGNLIPVELEWAGDYADETGPAIREGVVILADPLKSSEHVDASVFRSPHRAGVNRVVVSMHPPFEEITGVDNETEKPLPDISPEITMIEASDPRAGGLIRKAEYRPSVTIRNNSPIPVEVSVGWAEEFMPVESWDEGKLVEIVDPRDGTDAVEVNFINAGDFHEPGEVLKLDAGAEEKLPLDGVLKRSWDWIDPDLTKLVERTVRDLLPIYFDKEGALSDAVETARTEPTQSMISKIGKDLVGDGSLSFAATPTVPVTYSVTATALGNNFQSVTEHSQTETMRRSTDSHTALRMMEQVLHYVAVQTVLGKYGNDFETRLTQMAIKVMVDQMEPLHTKAIDPPRYDYDVLTTPEDVLSALPPQSGLIDGHARDLEQMAALVEAEAVTQDRILGAMEDGQPASRVAQLANAASLSHAMLEVLSRLIIRQHITQAIAGAAAVPRDTDVVIDGLLASGMPDWFEPTARYILDESEGLETQVSAIASDTLRAQSLTIVNAAMEELRDAIAVRVTLLGEEVSPVGADELAELSARRVSLTERVDAGEVTTELMQETAAFVTEVRERILASNDWDGMSDELTRGYAAILKLQMADYSIAGLQASVESLVADEVIDNATGAELNNRYSDAIARLAAGDFAGAVEQLERMADDASATPIGELMQLSDRTRFIASWIRVDEPVRLPGDINLDGRVAFDDFLILSNHYGKPGSWADGDLDGSGLVDFADFLMLSGNFGLSSASVDELFAGDD